MKCGLYLLVALHQFQCLALDVILAADDVCEDWRQVSSFELGSRNLDVELPRIFVLEIKL